jgi:hypothetical protein
VHRPLARRPLDKGPLRANALNLTIGVVLTSGEAHDATAYTALMEERDSDPGVLLGDRAYDSNEIRRGAAARSSTRLIAASTLSEAGLSASSTGSPDAVGERLRGGCSVLTGVMVSLDAGTRPGNSLALSGGKQERAL